MKLCVEKSNDTSHPSDAAVEKVLRSLRSYGPRSYASLEDGEGNYVQVAGGGVTCMVERFDASTRTRERAFHDHSSPVSPDGTVLAFGGGEVKLMADEWLTADEVVAIFLAFNGHRASPNFVHWRSTPVLETDLR